MPSIPKHWTVYFLYKAFLLNSHNSVITIRKKLNLLWHYYLIYYLYSNFINSPNKISYIFLLTKLIQDYTVHLLSCILSFQSGRVPKILSFFILTLLKTIGQLFCRMSLKLGLSYFLMIGFGFCLLADDLIYYLCFEVENYSNLFGLLQGETSYLSGSQLLSQRFYLEYTQ